DVVLNGARQARAWRALLVGDGDIEREQPGGRRIDRHRRIHAIERDAVEKRAHVADVADRDAHLADFAAGEHVVAVIARLRRQIEGDGEAGLPLREVGLVKRVRFGGRRVAGIGTEYPGLLDGLAHGSSQPRQRRSPSTANPSTPSVADPYCNATETFVRFRGCEQCTCGWSLCNLVNGLAKAPGGSQYDACAEGGRRVPAEISLGARCGAIALLEVAE